MHIAPHDLQSGIAVVHIWTKIALLRRFSHYVLTFANLAMAIGQGMQILTLADLGDAEIAAKEYCMLRAEILTRQAKSAD